MKDSTQSRRSKKAKKFVLNMVWGMLGTHTNKRQTCAYYTDEAVAREARFDNESQVLPMGSEKFWLVIEKRQRELCQGFLPLHALKMDLAQLHMWRLYGVLEDQGYGIVGVNTDCFYLDQPVDRLQRACPELFDGGGGVESIGKLKPPDPGNEDAQAPASMLHELPLCSPAGLPYPSLL